MAELIGKTIVGYIFIAYFHKMPSNKFSLYTNKIKMFCTKMEVLFKLYAAIYTGAVGYIL